MVLLQLLQDLWHCWREKGPQTAPILEYSVEHVPECDGEQNVKTAAKSAAKQKTLDKKAMDQA